jgi:hypothetical protein
MRLQVGRPSTNIIYNIWVKVAGTKHVQMAKGRIILSRNLFSFCFCIILVFSAQFAHFSAGASAGSTPRGVCPWANVSTKPTQLGVGPRRARRYSIPGNLRARLRGWLSPAWPVHAAQVILDQSQVV